jgi:hypothetical protein
VIFEQGANKTPKNTPKKHTKTHKNPPQNTTAKPVVANELREVAEEPV